MNNENMANKCVCKRWAFNLQKCLQDPDFEKKFRLSIQSVTPEEYKKSTSFRYKDDQIATLVSALLLRQATRRFTGVQWNEIEFQRTNKGKPYLVRPNNFSFGLNTSHQGEYTIFASSCTDRVGVDVMRLDMCRGNKTADEYINSMAKSASIDELRNMRGQATEQMKMTVFYRYWCLKESVLKATGEGIVDDLSRYDFRIIPSERYKQGCYLTSTTLLVDKKFQPQWIFEESFVDTNHIVAVCREKSLPSQCTLQKDPNAKIFFSQIDFNFLLEGATVLNQLQDDGVKDFNNFMQKPQKNF